MTGIRSPLVTAAAGLAIVALLPGRLDSQGTRRIVVTPYAGVFVPASKLAHLQGGSANPGLGIRQQNALALGVNASYWFTDRAGVEVGGVYAFSDAKSLPGLSGGMPGFPSATENAYVLAGSAKLMLNLLPLSDRTALRLGVGPALIRRDGTAFKEDNHGSLTGLTDVGGAISLCTRLPITDLISVRVRAENYIYQTQLRYWDNTSASNDIVFDRKVQNDLIFSAGLQMVFWR